MKNKKKKKKHDYQRKSSAPGVGKASTKIPVYILQQVETMKLLYKRFYDDISLFYISASVKQFHIKASTLENTNKTLENRKLLTPSRKFIVTTFNLYHYFFFKCFFFSFFFFVCVCNCVSAEAASVSCSVKHTKLL